VRIASHASEQYRNIASTGNARREQEDTRARATVTTTSFGFRLGKFGVDYQSSSTVLDPSLSPESRAARQQARAFTSQAEIEELRARVGTEGASYRQQSMDPGRSAPSRSRIATALAAYARSAAEGTMPPGSMLASVV